MILSTFSVLVQSKYLLGRKKRKEKVWSKWVAPLFRRGVVGPRVGLDLILDYLFKVNLYFTYFSFTIPAILNYFMKYSSQPLQNLKNLSPYKACCYSALTQYGNTQVHSALCALFSALFSALLPPGADFTAVHETELATQLAIFLSFAYSIMWYRMV